jgi:hypothetical protein
MVQNPKIESFCLHQRWSKSAVPTMHKQKKLFFPLQML